VNETLTLTTAELRAPFQKTTTFEKVGLEVELAAVDPITGISCAYDGNRGIGVLLQDFCQHFSGHPVIEEGHVIGVEFSDGTTVTIEPGGAIEYSSPPHETLVECQDSLDGTLRTFAEIANERQVALLAAGCMPFNKLAKANWMPKSRYSIMRDYFATLGDNGSLAHRMMTQTLSVQTSFDFHDDEDIAAKFPPLVMAAPIATALFANSPLEEGKLLGGLSRRGQIWLKTDPDRCGFVPPALAKDMSLEKYIEWALNVPMIFRVVNGVYLPMHGKTFASVLAHGFSDGSQPTLQDWQNHLSGIFTDVRLKNVIEMRSMDGQNFHDIPAVPSFWTGLVYSKTNLEAIKDRLGHLSPEEHERGLYDIVQRGFEARYGKEPVLELARDLVAMARSGLKERIAAGLEDEKALTYLQSLESIVNRGQSRARQLIDLWRGDLKQSPELFVKRFRVPGH
jgi:glutamate--cysteine ligase